MRAEITLSGSVDDWVDTSRQLRLRRGIARGVNVAVDDVRLDTLRAASVRFGFTVFQTAAYTDAASVAEKLSGASTREWIARAVREETGATVEASPSVTSITVIDRYENVTSRTVVDLHERLLIGIISAGAGACCVLGALAALLARRRARPPKPGDEPATGGAAQPLPDRRARVSSLWLVHQRLAPSYAMAAPLPARQRSAPAISTANVRSLGVGAGMADGDAPGRSALALGRRFSISGTSRRELTRTAGALPTAAVRAHPPLAAAPPVVATVSGASSGSWAMPWRTRPEAEVEAQLANIMVVEASRSFDA